MDTDRKHDERFTKSDVAISKLESGSYTQQPIPIPKHIHEAPRAITSAEKEFKAYETLKEAWQWEKDQGKRDIEAKKVSFTVFLSHIRSSPHVY